MGKNKTDKGTEMTNNCLQDTSQKTKELATRIPTKTGDGYSFCSTIGTRRVSLVTNSLVSHEQRKD
jgi:hypothetical protein